MKYYVTQVKFCFLKKNIIVKISNFFYDIESMKQYEHFQADDFHSLIFSFHFVSFIYLFIVALGSYKSLERKSKFLLKYQKRHSTKSTYMGQNMDIVDCTNSNCTFDESLRGLKLHRIHQRLILTGCSLSMYSATEQDTMCYLSPSSKIPPLSHHKKACHQGSNSQKYTSTVSSPQLMIAILILNELGKISKIQCLR